MPKPAEPPRPGRRPSVTEIVEPVRGPLVPELVPTAPPPAMPKAPPKELAGPRVKQSSVRHETRPDLIAELAEETRAAKAEAEALREALAAKPPPTPIAASETPTRAQWQTAGFRVLVSLGAVLTALATILGVRSTTTIEPKVDRTATKQAEQETKTVSVEDRLLALERYNRARSTWQRCMDAERDSAIERGTGHKVEGAHEDVSWIEQNQPKAVPRTLWKTAPWSISKDQSGCGAEPAPPVTPQPPVPP